MAAMPIRRWPVLPQAETAAGTATAASAQTAAAARAMRFMEELRRMVRLPYPKASLQEIPKAASVRATHATMFG
ncbi:hypothetical protein GCM10009422_01240 [Brevundimonas kwangchunensis]|uniref:Uncharacterized protein n=1 Tax=Brevundimonas kwangchunensis TaxID=322163 RepID=A0ABN1GF16_9CAUL